MFGIDISAQAAKIGLDNLWQAVQSFLYGIVVPKTAGTGIKVDIDEPTFGWADILGEIVIRTPSANGAPTFAAYIGSIYAYSFGTAAGVKEVFINYHVPHDIVPSSDAFVHTHWSTIASPTGNVNWMYDIAYAKGYSVGLFEGFPASGAVAVVPVAASSGAAYQHVISEVQIATPGGLVSFATNVSITSGQATLMSAAPLFASHDIGRTIRVVGAGPAGGNLDTTITAFTSTQQVTLGNNASTTVTAQPNYRHRLIDSDLILPDGLFLLRIWRDSSRAADTLNVEPFMHYTDMHYQTNGITGTKTRNTPFYT